MTYLYNINLQYIHFHQPSPQSRNSQEKSKLDDPSQHLLVNSPGVFVVFLLFLTTKKKTVKFENFSGEQLVNDGGCMCILHFTNLPMQIMFWEDFNHLNRLNCDEFLQKNPELDTLKLIMVLLKKMEMK